MTKKKSASKKKVTAKKILADSFPKKDSNFYLVLLASFVLIATFLILFL